MDDALKYADLVCFMKNKGVKINKIKKAIKMMRQTSIDAYFSLDKEELGLKQQRVYDFIKLNPGCSDREISDGLNIRINSITARRNELFEMGLIIEHGKKKDIKTNRSVYVWRCV